MHRVPLPRALLTILGYGALPYEKTSHSSTPKLQTSDLLENRCGGRGQVRRSPRPSPLYSVHARRTPCALGSLEDQFSVTTSSSL